MQTVPDARRLAVAGRPLLAAGLEAIRADLEVRDPRHSVRPVGALARKAGVFVTLRIEERLRGCIGSLQPVCANLVDETMDRARAAAFDDPRFPPLTLIELDDVSIEVSILGPLESIGSLDELDPDRYGIEVADGEGRRAVLLPGIDGVDSVDRQVGLTREKAGIPAGVGVDIRRFAVVKIG